jgi:dimethylglycine dehydrogenase
LSAHSPYVEDLDYDNSGSQIPIFDHFWCWGIFFRVIKFFCCFLTKDKKAFTYPLGRQSLIQQKKEGLAEKLVLMTVETDDADTIGDESVYMEDEIVGRITSGGYGHAVEKSLAMAYVKSELAKPGTRVEISILGKRCPAQVVPISYYDPENKRLKG